MAQIRIVPYEQRMPHLHPGLTCGLYHWEVSCNNAYASGVARRWGGARRKAKRALRRMLRGRIP